MVQGRRYRKRQEEGSGSDTGSLLNSLSSASPPDPHCSSLRLSSNAAGARTSATSQHKNLYKFHTHTKNNHVYDRHKRIFRKRYRTRRGKSLHDVRREMLCLSSCCSTTATCARCQDAVTHNPRTSERQDRRASSLAGDPRSHYFESQPFPTRTRSQLLRSIA